MADEISALHHTKTWVLVPRPPRVNIVGSKWVFKTKSSIRMRALYGLKQSPRAWYARLSALLAELGFHSYKADSSPSLIFTTGLEASYSSGEMTLIQRNYPLDLLHRVSMENCRATSTSLATGDLLSCESGTPLDADDSFRYRNVVGGLQYLTLTRPDLSFAVNKVCQFLSHPTDVHWEAVKRILRYVKGTPSTGLHFRKSATTSISIFTDVDWAGCVDDRRSTGGFAVFVGSNLISWSSMKQPTVSRSSTEAEYKALANGAAKAFWVESLLSELGISPQRIPHFVV
ncbi:uncharacterized mitochondrial protein AtMg00810-like [Lolium perenne]|uniref:uncharacterized mitochondrial protein AtMg00810-like n=1 Tax=Lolium perenne TaxID=4522 RepID=UPI0021F5CE63|nr:uncharacterized mitochondrial protein AtMg00810-like [Lolium perenne]